MKTPFISLVLVSIITAALPPGYDEELYCPANKCLAENPRRPGWSGPRASFHKCCNKVDPDSSPLSWGVKKGNDLKEKWLAEGCHQDVCIPGKNCFTKTYTTLHNATQTYIPFKPHLLLLSFFSFF